MLFANPVDIGISSVICELAYNLPKPSWANEGGTGYLMGFPLMAFEIHEVIINISHVVRLSFSFWV